MAIFTHAENVNPFSVNLSEAEAGITIFCDPVNPAPANPEEESLKSLLNGRRQAVEGNLRAVSGLILQLGMYETRLRQMAASPCMVVQMGMQIQPRLAQARTLPATLDQLAAEIRPPWEKLGSPGPASGAQLGWVSGGLSGLTSKAEALRAKVSALDTAISDAGPKCQRPGAVAPAGP